MKRWHKIALTALLALCMGISLAALCSSATEENVRETRDTGSTETTSISDLNGHIRFKFVQGEYAVTGAWANQTIFRDNPFSINGEDAFTGLATILTDGVTTVQAVRSNGSKVNLVDGDILQFLNEWHYSSDSFSERVLLCITSTFKNMPSWTPDTSTPYQTIYSTLSHYIFSDDFDNVPFGSFWCSGIAVIICMVLALLPFVLVYWIITRFGGR